MKKYILLLFVALLITPLKAQHVVVSVDKATTTASKIDQRVWNITYWLLISTSQQDVIQVCDSFGHASLYDSWLFKSPGKAQVHSTMFCWVFAGDTIWADKCLNVMDEDCYILSSKRPASITITMDDTYLISYYGKHSDLWPTLSAFGEFFVENSYLLYYLDGVYYRAKSPNRLVLNYLSNEHVRIYD